MHYWFLKAFLILVLMFPILVPDLSIAGTQLQPSGPVAWEDHFEDGEPNSQPARWDPIDTVGKTTTNAFILYSYTPSYAYITRTAGANIEMVTSEEISFNTAEYNTLEIRIADIAAQIKTEWAVTIREMTEWPLHKFSGATGIFYFDLTERWSGSYNARIELALRGELEQYIEIDYVKLYHYPSNQSFFDFWAEDFRNGESGTNVTKWWDNNDIIEWNTTHPVNEHLDYTHATINFLNDSARITKTEASTPDSAPYVNSPGIFLDLDKHHIIRIKIDELSQNTACVLKIYELGGNNWPQFAFARITKPGTYELDLKKEGLPDSWFKESMFFIHLVIEAYPIGSYADIDYLTFSRYYNQKVIPEYVPNKKAWSHPNPFNPLKTTSHFYFNQERNATFYTIRILNIKGQKIRTLHNTNEWDGRNENGKLCENGVYLYQIILNNKTSTGHITLIK